MVHERKKFHSLTPQSETSPRRHLSLHPDSLKSLLLLKNWVRTEAETSAVCRSWDPPAGVFICGGLVVTLRPQRSFVIHLLSSLNTDVVQNIWQITCRLFIWFLWVSLSANHWKYTFSRAQHMKQIRAGSGSGPTKLEFPDDQQIKRWCCWSQLESWSCFSPVNKSPFGSENQEAACRTGIQAALWLDRAEIRSEPCVSLSMLTSVLVVRSRAGRRDPGSQTHKFKNAFF